MLPLQTPDTPPHAHTESIFQGNCQYFRLMLTETLLGASTVTVIYGVTYTPRLPCHTYTTQLCVKV